MRVVATYARVQKLSIEASDRKTLANTGKGANRAALPLPLSGGSRDVASIKCIHIDSYFQRL